MTEVSFDNLRFRGLTNILELAVSGLLPGNLSQSIHLMVLYEKKNPSEVRKTGEGKTDYFESIFSFNLNPKVHREFRTHLLPFSHCFQSLSISVLSSEK